MALTRATADRQQGNSDCEDGDLHGGVQEALAVSGCGVRCRSVSECVGASGGFLYDPGSTSEAGGRDWVPLRILHYLLCYLLCGISK